MCGVTEAPKITAAPTDQKVVENGAVTLFCRASGHPTPDVYWRRGGRRITANHQRYTVVTVQQGGVAVLRIEPAKPRRDDSVFECVAENGVGDPATATSKVEVYPEGHGKKPNVRVYAKCQTTSKRRTDKRTVRHVRLSVVSVSQGVHPMGNEVRCFIEI